ncbi:glucose-6-phosphate isomerase [Ahrensia kielensis]|uniref:glucose-6-phosphate isomerase n=1 Tax=Ahrensia kielensis TaxID=76980 RepID=UPI00035E8645|nr:glucose-6-phosphate isomerase [Ahrensia kielensis]
MTSKSKATEALKSHFENDAPKDMRAAFSNDPKRFEKNSATFDDLLLDWSKCAVNDQTLTLLEDLAIEKNVASKRDAMFDGDHINITEDRAVLHTALRNRSNLPIIEDGKDVMHDVNAVLDQMGVFSEGVRSGEITASNGKKFTDIVNIGIGGSDLGPAMAVLALAPYHDGPRCHFVSNIDGAHIADTLKNVHLETTLFIIASKTFTTIETMTNAQTARRAIVEALSEDAVAHHFCAVSTALDKVADFGIAEDRIFGFWDWVGGRYSLWGAIGLPVMMAIGAVRFGEFLDGAYAMDKHFKDAPVRENLPMMLGLIGYYHRAICDYSTRAVIPYDQRLSRLAAYLQQLDMESNGKSVTLDSQSVCGPSGPIVWGEPGTNGQHAFFQLLHQGTDIIPVEFIVAATAHETGMDVHHQLLLANCFAQSEALMKGRTLEEAHQQLTDKGMRKAEADRLAPHKVFSGNRPSTTLVYKKLTPFALGRLIALYEHRVFVEAQLYGINAFDQWGVELGKELATALLPVVQTGKGAAKLDSSTAALVKYALDNR